MRHDDVVNPHSDPTAPAASIREDGATRAVTLDDRTISLARQAAESEAGGSDAIGGYSDAVAEDECVVSASFESTASGYRGWRWVVSLALVDPEHPTVSEVVLLPGPDALLAPPWVPWERRVRSGDLKVGDLLPPAPDDFRLAPAYLLSDDPAVEQVAHELGIGRVRVLSWEGREDAAQRWHEGQFGPADAMAMHAPAHCVTCAFYLPLAGSLGAMLGACGNEYSPADGRVVDAGFGCGAHSEVLSLADVPARSAAAATVIDELRLELHDRPDSTVPALISDPGGTDLDTSGFDSSDLDTSGFDSFTTAASEDGANDTSTGDGLVTGEGAADGMDPAPARADGAAAAAVSTDGGVGTASGGAVSGEVVSGGVVPDGVVSGVRATDRPDRGTSVLDVPVTDAADDGGPTAHAD